jgi:hypothetical protein
MILMGKIHVIFGILFTLDGKIWHVEKWPWEKRTKSCGNWWVKTVSGWVEGESRLFTRKLGIMIAHSS